MEPESVLIIATVFIMINFAIIICSELYRDSTSDNLLRDTITRLICPTNLLVSILAMIGAQKKNSILLLPFLGILALFIFCMAIGAIYIASWCPYKLFQGESNFVCSMGIILGVSCIAGILFGSCQTYIVLSLFRFIRKEAEDKRNNPTELELIEKFDAEHPSTSY